jgi:hypothetical protein
LRNLLELKTLPGSFGFFEVDHDRASRTAQIFCETGYRTELHKDLSNRDRYLIVQK